MFVKFGWVDLSFQPLFLSKRECLRYSDAIYIPFIIGHSVKEIGQEMLCFWMRIM